MNAKNRHWFFVGGAIVLFVVIVVTVSYDLRHRTNQVNQPSTNSQTTTGTNDTGVSIPVGSTSPSVIGTNTGASSAAASHPNSGVISVSISAPVGASTGSGASVAATDLSKQFEIWNGGSSAERGAATTYGSVVADGNENVFNAAPDQWNSATLSLAGLPSYRKSISNYDYIQMSVRVVPHAGTTIPSNADGLFSIYAWPNTSAQVSLAKYLVDANGKAVTGGALAGSYQTVRIPVGALEVAGGFDLSSLESLQFSMSGGQATGAPTYSLDVANIYAIRLSANSVSTVQVVSDNALRVIASDRFPISDVNDPSQFILSGTGNGSQNPTKLGKQMFVNNFEGSTGGSYGLSAAPVVQPEIYLIFNKAFVNGQTYTLTVKNIPDEFGNNFTAPQTITFTYEDSSVTGSVQANQVGYLPTAPKFAYIGNYLGDAGALEAIPVAPASCEVVKVNANSSSGAASGAVVATFPTVHRGLDTELSGNDVYDCDFSSVTTPGTYYVYVPGYGKTYNFQIGDNVYDGVFRDMSDLYYNQRADTPIVDGQWSRPAGTLSSDEAAQLHPVDYIESADNPLAVDTTDYPKGMTYDMTGGWYDAGDYGKYVLPATAAVNTFLFSYELFPQKFADGQADIPENHDGIPDVLNEVKYEIDWLQKMQAVDGGVFDRVTAQNWEKNPYDIETRYIAPESTHDTAAYAAALAEAYRVFKSNAAFEKAYPGYAEALLLKAEKAWKFLVAHPTPLPANGISVSGLGIGGGDYQDVAHSNNSTDPSNSCTFGTTGCPYSDVDNRAWAAAELYKSTGDAEYAAAFVTDWSQNGAFDGLYNDFVYDNPKASLTYVTTTQYPTDQTIDATIKSALKTVADQIVTYTYANDYRVGYRLDVPSYINWGAFGQSAENSYTLIIASTILRDSSYIAPAEINLDVELGANPQSRSYITGEGSAPPQNPLHLTSVWLRQSGGATAPVPGIPVFGPSYLGSEADLYMIQAQSDTNVYPSIHSGAYPILRRYFDLSALVEQSEFGIGSSASILAAFAYFSNY